MNKELYENIKTELDSLEEELVTPSYVGGHLLGQKLLGKNKKDMFTIVYAFYEYMSERDTFSFIKDGNWADFYRNNLSNYLTEDVIKNNLYDIVSNEKLVDTILKVCNNDVKKNLYKYVNVENTIHIKTGSNKYADIFKKIEGELLKQGLIVKKEETKEEVVVTSNETSSSIDAEIADLKRKQEELEKQKLQRRDTMFSEAADSIGISDEKLIKKVGEEESLVIDKIVLDPSLVSKLAANSAVAATMPRNSYEKFKSRILTFCLKINIYRVEDETILKLSQKGVILEKMDKIATGVDGAIRDMAKFIRNKKSLFSSMINTSKKRVSMAKNAICNFGKSVSASIISSAINGYRNVSEWTEDKKVSYEQKIKDFENRISDYGVSTREKISESLHDMADKVAPKSDEEPIKEEYPKKETYTYINTPEGRRKVVVRAATKVGEVPTLNKEESSKKM